MSLLNLICVAVPRNILRKTKTKFSRYFYKYEISTKSKLNTFESTINTFYFNRVDCKINIFFLTSLHDHIVLIIDILLTTIELYKKKKKKGMCTFGVHNSLYTNFNILHDRRFVNCGQCVSDTENVVYRCGYYVVR